MKPTQIIHDRRGETFIELLISTLIIGMTLTVIISVFLSGRTGVVSAWKRTDGNVCAISILEQIKSLPYTTVIELYTEFATDGQAERIDFSATSLSVDDAYASYEIQFDLLPYKSYPVEELIQVNVRVREKDDLPWTEKSTLLRKGAGD